MRILFLINPYSIHDQKWISFFTDKEKYECYFITLSEQKDLKSINQFSITNNITYLGNVEYVSIRRPIKTIRKLLFIKKIVREHGINLFHIQYAEPNVLWACFRSTINIPIIVTCRGTDVLQTIPSHFKKKDILNRIIQKLYKSAFNKVDHITVTSIKQKKAIELLSQTSTKISLIRTGINYEEIQIQKESKINKKLEKEYLLFPRYIKPIYRHEFTLEALKRLPNSIKKNYQMVFVGKDGGDLKYQQDLLNIFNQNLDLDIIFLPQQSQSEILFLILNASIVIMNPISDGSPVSAMEAIASNTPVILGPLDYDTDIFNDKTVFKLKEWSEDELSNTIIEILAKKEGKEIISSKIIDLIDRNTNMKKLEGIYFDINEIK
ncbi:MAG: glycosyltransferase involved in cell wall biosynthesis [Psychroserpens sp.]|jgi:glycosyltransferase involved in cell wall biosynthesis